MNKTLAESMPHGLKVHATWTPSINKKYNYWYGELVQV